MRKEKGSILIFTLWVLIILSILSIMLSRRASSDVKLAKYESNNIKATYLARAGVMKMLAELVSDKNEFDSLNEDWNRRKDNPKKFKLGNSTVYYGASDEMGRLNLNSATPQDKAQKTRYIARYIEQLGRMGIDSTLANEILKYKIEEKEQKGAKGFEFAEELFLASEDMNKDIYREIEDYVTIYRGEDSEVNINTASEEVLYVIIGNESLVQDILEYRRGPDGEEGTEDDEIFRDSSDISIIEGIDPALFTVKSDFYRIWAQVSFSDDEKIFKEVEAVVDKSSREIIHWKEY